MQILKYDYENLLKCNVFNEKLSFIWLAKMDNLMVLKWLLPISIWMLNMWMEWLIWVHLILGYEGHTAFLVEKYVHCFSPLLVFLRQSFSLGNDPNGNVTLPVSNARARSEPAGRDFRFSPLPRQKWWY